MLTIIHGDDTASSRTFYINAKKRTSHPITLEADQVNLTDLIQILDGGGLFGEERNVFIESLLTKKKKGKELTAILAELDSQTNANIYLWEGKEIDKRVLSSLKHAKSQIFTLPKSLFQFLDSLKPKSTTSLKLFHQTLKTVEVEMVFFMIIRQMRFLLAVYSRTDDPIDEVKRMAPWQKQKLERQSRAFKKDALIKHYRALAEIDLAQKTGNLPVPLTSAIDFWLLDI